MDTATQDEQTNHTSTSDEDKVVCGRCGMEFTISNVELFIQHKQQQCINNLQTTTINQLEQLQRIPREELQRTPGETVRRGSAESANESRGNTHIWGTDTLIMSISKKVFYGFWVGVSGFVVWDYSFFSRWLFSRVSLIWFHIFQILQLTVLLHMFYVRHEKDGICLM